ncbi:hypothetical protein ABFS82_14G136500 [Erythranthe guttata]
MKQLNSSSVQRNNTFSSIFVKFGVCFLFLGLAYRLFSSSFVQFSPVLLGDGGDTGLPVDTTTPPPPRLLAEPPPETTDVDRLVSPASHNASQNFTETCDLFTGEWIPDPNGPMYTNTTCRTIESPQNCMKNGRPDFDYVYWRWKPKDCNLPKFDPKKFLNIMRYKSLAFIGDSIMRNHVQSLLCMLSPVEEAVEIYHDKTYRNRRWSFPTHHFTVSVIWSPFLMKAFTFEDDNGVSTGLIKLHLDEVDPVWTNAYEDLDYVIIAGGKWFLKSALYYENKTLVGCHNCHNENITQLGFGYAYEKALSSTFKFMADSKKEKNKTPFILFRTSAPDHFENGEWDTGGYCNRSRPFKMGEIEINDTDEIMRRVELGEFERAYSSFNDGEVSLMKMFDPTMLSLLRPDGHPGVYREFHPYEGKGRDAKIQNDCLHWCLPGPIDSWNDLIMEMLVKDSKL